MLISLTFFVLTVQAIFPLTSLCKKTRFKSILFSLYLLQSLVFSSLLQSTAASNMTKRDSQIAEPSSRRVLRMASHDVDMPTALITSNSQTPTHHWTHHFHLHLCHPLQLAHLFSKPQPLFNLANIARRTCTPPFSRSSMVRDPHTSCGISRLYEPRSRSRISI